MIEGPIKVKDYFSEKIPLQRLKDFPRDEALQAADDVPFGEPFGASAFHVDLGRWIEA